MNHLLIIFIDDSPVSIEPKQKNSGLILLCMTNQVSILIFFKPETATEPASPLVPFLQKFAEPRNKKTSVSILSNNIFDLTLHYSYIILTYFSFHIVSRY